MKKKKIVLIAAIVCVVAAALGFGIKHTVKSVARHEVNTKLPSASATDFVDTLLAALKENYNVSNELYCTDMSFYFDENGNTSSGNVLQSMMILGDAETGTDYYIVRRDDKEENPIVKTYVSGKDRNYHDGEIVYLPVSKMNEIFKNVNFGEIAEKYFDEKCSTIHVGESTEYKVQHKKPYNEYKEVEAYDFDMITLLYTDGEVKQIFNSGEITEDCLSLTVSNGDNGIEIAKVRLLIPYVN